MKESYLFFKSFRIDQKKNVYKINVNLHFYLKCTKLKSDLYIRGKKK